jgi:hypothetical protein
MIAAWWTCCPARIAEYSVLSPQYTVRRTASWPVISLIIVGGSVITAFAQDAANVPPDEPRSTITESLFSAYVYGNGPVLVLRLAPAAVNKARAVGAPAPLVAPRVNQGEAIIIEAEPDVPFREVQAAIQDANAPAPVREVRLVQPATSTSSGSAEKTRAQFAAALAEEIHTVDQYCGLTEAQRKKLDLAGRGDIKQFFDRVEELRTSYVGPPLTRDERARAITEMRRVNQLLQAGLLHDESLFRKTLRQTLTPEQRERHTRLFRDRDIAAWEKLLVEWDKRALDISLSADSRRKLAGLLLDHSPQLEISNARAYWTVTLQISALDESQLRPLFTAAEWPTLQHELQEARDLEPILRAHGEWPIPLRPLQEIAP